MRSKVFISYSHADRRWLDQLQVFLKPVERTGLIERWDDTKLEAGQKWRDEIHKALESAKVAVLLVSANFLASDFIADQEIPPLLAAAERDGALILSVIVSPCDLPPSLSQFQAVNDPKKTLVDMKKGERDRVWIKVVKSIESAISESPSDPKPEEKSAPADERRAEQSSQTRASAPSKSKSEKTGSTLSVGEELELEGIKGRDIAAVKGEDVSNLVPTGSKIEVLKNAKIKDSELEDIVGIKQEGRTAKDKE